MNEYFKKSSQVVLLLIMMTGFAFAQDTIFYKKAGNIVVLVKEESPTEVQYKKVEMPDGPMYIINKSDIEKIVYKNGYVELIKESVAETTTPTQQPFAVTYTSPVDVNLEKINYSDTKLRYSSLVRLIDRHPDPNRRNDLMKMAKSLKSLKRHQDGTRTGAIIFGGIAIGGGLLYSAIYSLGGFSYGSDGYIFAVPPVAFGTLALICGTTSIIINVNLKKKRHNFVNLYNQ